MIPVLKSPAYPHWILTPSAITAEIRQRLRMVSATTQLCTNPVASSSAAITA